MVVRAREHRSTKRAERACYAITSFPREMLPTETNVRWIGVVTSTVVTSTVDLLRGAYNLPCASCRLAPAERRPARHSFVFTWEKRGSTLAEQPGQLG